MCGELRNCIWETECSQMPFKGCEIGDVRCVIGRWVQSNDVGSHIANPTSHIRCEIENC